MKKIIKSLAYNILLVLAFVALIIIAHIVHDYC